MHHIANLHKISCIKILEGEIPVPIFSYDFLLHEYNYQKCASFILKISFIEMVTDYSNTLAFKSLLNILSIELRILNFKHFLLKKN